MSVKMNVQSGHLADGATGAAGGDKGDTLQSGIPAASPITGMPRMLDEGVKTGTSAHSRAWALCFPDTPPPKT